MKVESEVAGLRTSRELRRLSTYERAQRGKSARREAPFSDHARWAAPADRRAPIELLEEQALTRVPELVPIRYGRMMVSPFSYFRGAALPMAADLASTPVSGIEVQLCGDAHMSNFGVFGSPERHLIFDLNDFDETAPGPWEWDVKRLAASIEIAGRENGYSEKATERIVRHALRSYRETMQELASVPMMSVWYAHLNVEEISPALQRALASQRKPRMSGRRLRKPGPTTAIRPSTNSVTTRTAKRESSMTLP